MNLSATSILRAYITLIITLMLVYACSFDVEEMPDPSAVENLEINLRWYTGSFDQSREEIYTGFQWALSYLGAELPMGSFREAVMTESAASFTIDLAKTGFSPDAETALQRIATTIKNSPAYETTGSVELGRFIMLTLNSSYHYFKITGMPETIDSFRAAYQFNGKKTRIINSAISDVNRLIEIADATDAAGVAYLASEGRGQFEDNSFEAEEFEVLDYMPNGQFRYGLYDLNGRLKAAAEPGLTRAGKPAKCQWCHEIVIQPFFSEMPVLPGKDFLSEDEFLSIRAQFTTLIADHRKGLEGEIDYSRTQDHALMERIYIDFMEPSVMRVASEWGLSQDSTIVLLSGLETHTQPEYGIPDLYHRKDIDKLAPVRVIEVPESAREYSANEPNFFLIDN